MRCSVLLLLLALSLGAGGCESSRSTDASPKNWYKGNLHTHSLWSDGDDFPEMIVDWYRSHGYQFLAISDHNILSTTEKWLENDLVIRRGGRRALAEYRQRFPGDWVETRTVQGKLEVRMKRLDEFRGLFEQRDEFLLIQGEEITAQFEVIPVHINASNVGELIEPQGGSSVRDVIDKNLRQVAAQSERLKRPILAHLNHPNFGYAVTAEDLAAVLAEHFFEVYNGHPKANNRGDELHASSERIWDIANTLRLSKGAAPLMGLATDDSHDYHGPAGSTPGRGWVMVRAATLSAEALIEAMEAGDFYASTGVLLEAVNWRDGRLSLDIQPVAGVTFVTRFVGSERDVDMRSRPPAKDETGLMRASLTYTADIGKTFATVTGLHPSYVANGSELYVRAVVTSSEVMDNPVIGDERKMAWTQPVAWRR